MKRPLLFLVRWAAFALANKTTELQEEFAAQNITALFPNDPGYTLT